VDGLWSRPTRNGNVASGSSSPLPIKDISSSGNWSVGGSISRWFSLAVASGVVHFVTGQTLRPKAFHYRLIQNETGRLLSIAGQTCLVFQPSVHLKCHLAINALFEPFKPTVAPSDPPATCYNAGHVAFFVIRKSGAAPESDPPICSFRIWRMDVADKIILRRCPSVRLSDAPDLRLQSVRVGCRSRR
jgi:hypothetical protein